MGLLRAIDSHCDVPAVNIVRGLFRVLPDTASDVDAESCYHREAGAHGGPRARAGCHATIAGHINNAVKMITSCMMWMTKATPKPLVSKVALHST